MTKGNNSKSNVAKRRKQVFSMLSQFATQEEIAQRLDVDQSTINRDIKHFKQVSRSFVFDLAKSDLSYYYMKSLHGIEEVGHKAEALLNDENEQKDMKEKVMLLKLMMEANERIFSLLSEGPGILNSQNLETRIDEIEKEHNGRQDN